MSILNFFKGFAVTLGKLNHASESGEVVTTHYPEEKRSKPKRPVSYTHLTLTTTPYV